MLHAIVPTESPAPLPAVTAAVPLPAPRCAITIRAARLDDLPCIDALQKIHARMVGWFPRKQIESYITRGDVLVADGGIKAPGDHGINGADSDSAPRRLDASMPSPLGYCIARDRYCGRDDVGIFYQLNVAPGSQRHLVGAALVQATIAKAAYGCRLYSCWCAQDISANRFWEACGFVPLAFRAGSRGKQRIHIFWQRRVRMDDGETPFWFPCQTRGGAIREDRLVLPIPPGTHWSDAKPHLAPTQSRQPPQHKEVHGAVASRQVSDQPPAAAAARRRTVGLMCGGRVRSAMKRQAAAASHIAMPRIIELPKPRQRRTYEAVHFAKARELRDRFLEDLNATDAMGSLLIRAKYDVGRELPPLAPFALKESGRPRLATRDQGPSPSHHL